MHKHKALKARLSHEAYGHAAQQKMSEVQTLPYVTEYKLTVQQHDCNCAEAVLIVKQLEPYPKIVLVMTPSGCKMHNKRPFFFFLINVNA